MGGLLADQGFGFFAALYMNSDPSIRMKQYET